MMKVVELNSERGFALVLALVFMLSMTIIGISVVTNMSTEMHLASNERDAKVAFQVSESGLQEALARIHLAASSGLYVGEASGLDQSTRNPAWSNTFTSSEGDLDYTVTINYLLEYNTAAPVAGSVDHGFCDVNSTAPNPPGTLPPAGTCSADGEIVYFGQDFNIDPNTSKVALGQFPVYEITSVGTAPNSNTTRTVTAYVGSSNLNLDTGFAIDTNACLNISGGAANISGPIQNRDSGGCGACASPDGCTDRALALDGTVLDEYLGLPLLDIQAMADEIHYCINSPCSGDDDIPASGMIDGVVQDWGDYAGDTYGSYIYIDANGTNDVTISGDFNGRGLLMVDGDLKISGNFNFEGLVYVKGTLTLSGGGSSTNITGGLVAGSTVQINGGLIVTYDQAVLEDISRQNKSQALLLWRRE